MNMKKSIFIAVFFLVSSMSFGQNIVTNDINALCIAEYYVYESETIKGTTDVAFSFNYNVNNKVLKVNTLYTDDTTTGKWYAYKAPSIMSNVKIKYYIKDKYYYYYEFIRNNVTMYTIKSKSKSKIKDNYNFVYTIYLF